MTARILFCLLCGHASLVLGIDRYVTPTGLTTNAGTLGSPWSIGKAASSAQPGDVVHVGGGTYTTKITITVSGTASNRIIFKAKQGEVPVFDMQGIAPSGGQAPILRISSRDYVTIQGLTLCNNITTSSSVTPLGILVSGPCDGIELRDNVIHHIEQNNPTLNSFESNAHGILVEGTSSSPLDGIIVDGNVLHDLHLGASEGLVLNGNVTNFRVSRNTVFDCNNIGIDIIGYEGTAPSNVDRARNGIVSGNVVHGIDSSFNPAYGGSLTTGGGDRAAAGIYVDGGTQTIIEGNLVYDCNFGVELAAENGSGFTDYITLRNNLLRHNQQSGLIMGGYDSQRGTTEHCVIEGNTFYENDTLLWDSAQITFQFYVRNNTFRNNIICAQRSSRQMVNHFASGSAGTIGVGNTFSHNLYYYEGAGGSPQPFFRLRLSSGFQNFTSLASWQASSGMGDSGSTFESPGFVNPLPAMTSPPEDYRLSDSSAAINTGLAAFAAAAGERDFFLQSRVQGGRVDRGMAER